jgi:hypothetical protein
MELLFHDDLGAIDSFRGGGVGDMDLRVNVYKELGLRVNSDPDFTVP